MILKIEELEAKINLLIDNYKKIKEENNILKKQLLEKDNKIKQFEESRNNAVNKLNNLIEILKKEGIFEEN